MTTPTHQFEEVGLMVLGLAAAFAALVWIIVYVNKALGGSENAAEDNDEAQ